MLLLKPEVNNKNTLVLGRIGVGGIGIVALVGVGLVVVSLIGWGDLSVGGVVPSLVLGWEVWY
jgi:hypothetical protein